MVDVVGKAITALVDKVPGIWAVPCLIVMVLLAVILQILRADVLKILSPEARDAAVTFIVKYGFAGAGVFCLAYFVLITLSIKSTSAEVLTGITKPAKSTADSSGQPNPIAAPQAAEDLSDSLVRLSWRLNPPPGIDEALAQLKRGNREPAIKILHDNILAEQKDKVSQAATLRQIALLEFYDNTKASLATYEQSVALDPDSWEAWGQIANLRERMGDHDGAAVAAQKTIDLGNKTHELNALGVGFGALGYIAANTGRNAEARPLLEKSRGYFLAAGSQAQYAAATNNLARIAFSDGNFDEAIRYYEDALATDTRIDDKRGIAADCAGLAQIYSERGRESKEYDKALDYFQRSIAANESVGDPHQGAMALSGMARVYRNRRAPGDLEKARDACTSALNLEKKIDNRSPQVVILGDLAEIARANQDFKEAEARYGEAIETAKSFKLSFVEAAQHRGLATLYLDEKKLIPALDEFLGALKLDQGLDRQSWVALDQSWVGVAHNRLQQKDEACAAWKEAADIYQAIGAEKNLDEVNQARTEAGCS